MPKPVYNVPVRPNQVSPWTIDDPWVFKSTTKVFLIPQSVARIGHAFDEIKARELPGSNGLTRFTYPLRTVLSGQLLGWETWFDGKMVPLSRATVGQRVLIWVERETPRPMCGSHPGDSITHTITRFEAGASLGKFSLDYECGEYIKYGTAVEGIHFELHRGVPPTCLDCAVAEWRQFFVSPHAVPQVKRALVKKAAKVEVQKERRFLSRPTRFDRVVDEVPEKSRRVVLNPPESDDEPNGRDAKLAARVRHGTLEKHKRESFKRERRWK